MAESRRELIISTAIDLASDFLYHARKEDEELPVGQIEEAIRAGEITVGEITEILHNTIIDAL